MILNCFDRISTCRKNVAEMREAGCKKFSFPQIIQISIVKSRV